MIVVLWLARYMVPDSNQHQDKKQLLKIFVSLTPHPQWFRYKNCPLGANGNPDQQHPGPVSAAMNSLTEYCLWADDTAREKTHLFIILYARVANKR